MAEVSITKLKDNKYQLSYQGITAIYTVNDSENSLEFLGGYEARELWSNPKMCEIYKVASELSRNV